MEKDYLISITHLHSAFHQNVIRSLVCKNTQILPKCLYSHVRTHVQLKHTRQILQHN